MAVIDNNFETKGTHVFFVDINGSNHTVVKLTCPTGITGINAGSKDKIDTTCLDNVSGRRTYIGGFVDSSELSIPFILYKGDASHQALFDLQTTGETTGWMIGFSDSTAVPTINTGSQLVTPAARTTVAFDGYISNVTLDASVNEVVRGTLTVQPTGPYTMHWAA